MTKLRLWQQEKHFKNKSNLNNVFRITIGNMKQNTQVNLWRLIQTPTSNTSNDLAQGTLFHNMRIQGKIKLKGKW